MRTRLTLLVVALAGGASACSGSAREEKEPPTALNYTIDFQNQRNAIGSTFLQVRVFDATTAGDALDGRLALCDDLVDRTKKGQPIPAEQFPLVAETAELSPCEVVTQSGQAGKGGALDVSYGIRAVLVVARNPSTGTPGADQILVGCRVGDVKADGAEPIVVRMERFSPFREAPDPKQCGRLTDRCNGSAACPAP